MFEHIKMCLLKMTYLGISTSEYVHHNLHDRLMHPQSSHQVGVLVEYPVAHNISERERQSMVATSVWCKFLTV